MERRWLLWIWGMVLLVSVQGIAQQQTEFPIGAFARRVNIEHWVKRKRPYLTLRGLQRGIRIAYWVAWR